MDSELPKIIYPNKIEKYLGNIKKSKSGKFQATIRSKTYKVQFCKTYDTYEEAFEQIKNKNIEWKLPIANLIYEFPDRLEVSLTKNKKFEN